MSAPLDPKAAAEESIRRNTAFALAAQVTGALFTGGLTLFLVRALGPSDYGVFVLAVGAGILLLLPSDFGVSQSAARFIAERRGDWTEIGAVLGDALTLKLVGSSLVSLGLIAAADPIAAAYDTDALAWPLRLVALAVFGQSVMGLFAGSFEALARNSLGFRLVVSESVMEAGASVALVLLGAGVTGAALGRAIGFAFGALMGVTLAVRLLGRGRLRLDRHSSFGFRRIALYAGALFVIEGAYALFTQIDILLIGAILGTTSAGLFGAPVRLLAFIQYPGLALAAGVAPRLARREDHSPNVGAFQAAIRFLLILQFLLVAPLLVWAEPFVDLLLGSGYEASAEVVRALTPWILLAGFAPLLSVAVNYLGEARRRVPLAISAVVLNAAIDVVLIPRIGIVAGAIGSDVAMLLYVGGHLWICRRMVALDLRALAATLARATLAFGGACGVLLVFGTGSLAATALVGGGLAAIATYVALLFVTGEVSRAELRAGYAALADALPRGIRSR